MAKASSKTKSTKAAAIALPTITKDERIAGLILENGKPKHWLILLPGEMASGTFTEAQAFAKKAGGDLPTREEQALLYANCKSEFQLRLRLQFCYHMGYSDRARAVRRVVI